MVNKRKFYYQVEERNPSMATGKTCGYGNNVELKWTILSRVLTQLNLVGMERVQRLNTGGVSMTCAYFKIKSNPTSNGVFDKLS